MNKSIDRARRLFINDRTIYTKGLKQSFWRDLNHRAMTLQWPQFFLSATVIFFGFNLIFTVLYALGNKPIANTPDNELIWLLYFSIETLATVGYGDMHPQTHWGHVIATVEIFTGMSFLAVYTGLIFARFARPTSRFIFAQHAVIGPDDGKQMLMIRIANERQNTISGATARLWLLFNRIDSWGKPGRRFVELKLLRTDNPTFALSWTLYHEINGESPLHNITKGGLDAMEGAVVLTLTGIDDTSGANLHARHSYSSSQIKWQHRFGDIFERTEAGDLLLNYDKIHETHHVTKK